VGNLPGRLVLSTLALVRHGQAAFGQANYDALSSCGVEQARKTGEFVASRESALSALLVGPRQRHAGTADALLAVRRAPPTTITIEPRLDEFAAGMPIMRRVLAGNSAPRAQRVAEYLALLGAWGNGTHVEPDCESFLDFVARVDAWLRHATGSSAPHQHIVAVTSAGVIAAAVMLTLQLQTDAWSRLIGVIRNASLTEIVFTPDRRNLLSFNSTAHLPKSLLTWI